VVFKIKRCSICREAGHNRRTCKNKPQNPVALTKSNQKRVETCRRIGSGKKRIGHLREIIFNKQFGTGKEEIDYGANADCELCFQNTHTLTLLKEFRWRWLDNTDIKYASLKSGKNLQFTLGVIPEITLVPLWEDKIKVWKQKEFWWKYLGKSRSSKPADVLVYYAENHWIFFRMSDVINYIADNVMVRYLKSGRIKGDFKDHSRKGFSQYLTFEYRKTHKSYFLGANCGRGEAFIKLLRANLISITIPVVDK
jgi:hypothetical protein